MPLNFKPFRKLLTKLGNAPKKIIEQVPARGLPVELLLEVIAYLENNSDLLNLSLTSKSLQAVAEVFLYNTIDITYNGTFKFAPARQVMMDSQRQTCLSRTLISNSRLAAIVTEFRVRMPWCTGYPSMQEEKIYKTLAPVCTCDELDETLGAILVSLVNLKVLHFSCQCSRLHLASVRHTHLGKLATSNLRELWFQCRCTTSDHAKQIFLSPCMRSVKSLRYDPVSAQSYYAPQQPGLLQHEGLPQLTRLMCSTVDSVSDLIGRGGLTHLVCNVKDKNLHQLLLNSPASLVYLRIQQVEEMVLTLAQNISPYRNIKHIGILQVEVQKSAELLDTVKALRLLPNLTSVDIFRYINYSLGYAASFVVPDLSDAILISELGKILVGLQNVHLCAYSNNRSPSSQLGYSGHEYSDWKRGDPWHGTAISQLEYSDRQYSDWKRG